MGTPDYLLDTSACSKYIQGLLDEETIDWMKTVLLQQSQMSVITRIELLSWTTGNKVLEEDIRLFITGSTIIELTEPIILQTVRLRRHYKSVRLPDAIIAATAIVHNLTLLSTNDSDFEKIASLKYMSLSN
jgi:predicted nucleic acid-binding protein